jgi:hypothetical protein
MLMTKTKTMKRRRCLPGKGDDNGGGGVVVKACMYVCMYVYLSACAVLYSLFYVKRVE